MSINLGRKPRGRGQRGERSPENMDAWKLRGEDISGRTDFSAVLCFSPCTSPLSWDLLALRLLLNCVTEGSYKAGTESHRGIPGAALWCGGVNVLRYLRPIFYQRLKMPGPKKKKRERVEMTEAN